MKKNIKKPDPGTIFKSTIKIYKKLKGKHKKLLLAFLEKKSAEIKSFAADLESKKPVQAASEFVDPQTVALPEVKPSVQLLSDLQQHHFTPSDNETKNT
jgi:hypothetical protein